MNEDKERPDPDEPIAPLAELEQEVSPQFLAAIRKKIYRRTAANQVVSFSWNLPRVIVMELVSLVAHFFRGSGKERA